MEGVVTVREIFTREYLGVSESDNLQKAVEILLSEPQRCAVVLRGQQPVGLLSEATALDFVVESGSLEGNVEDCMEAPPPSISPTASLGEAATELAETTVDCLTVMDGDELNGIVTVDDVVNATISVADRSRADVMADSSVVGESADVTVGSTGEPVREENAGSREAVATQSVCEVCGSLGVDLQQDNGRLVCADCRGM